jgi:transcriptional regulator with XRE-family HTH domain
MSDRIGIRLGRRIKQLREARGLTQAAFAQVSRKSVETISNFERGKTTPSLHTLSQLAKLLNVEMADFFDAQGLKPNTSAVNPQIEFLPTDDVDTVNALIKILHQKRSQTNQKRSRD